MCKNDSDVITLQIQCSGPIGGLTVTADSKANVKGYVNNPDVMLPPSKEGKLDVGKALDLGVLTVIKDIGLKEPYSGQTHLVSGEIAEDLTYYFAASEQIPTSVALGVLMNKDNTVRQAGGFIIQMMPYAEEETISKLEKKIAEFKEEGIEYTIRQIDTYRALGVEGIHLYALNKWKDVSEIINRSGLRTLV